jgi:hypothetical protein
MRIVICNLPDSLPDEVSDLLDQSHPRLPWRIGGNQPRNRHSVDAQALGQLLLRQTVTDLITAKMRHLRVPVSAQFAPSLF